MADASSSSAAASLSSSSYFASTFDRASRTFAESKAFADREEADRVRVLPFRDEEIIRHTHAARFSESDKALLASAKQNVLRSCKSRMLRTEVVCCVCERAFCTHAVPCLALERALWLMEEFAYANDLCEVHVTPPNRDDLEENVGVLLKDKDQQEAFARVMERERMLVTFRLDWLGR